MTSSPGLASLAPWALGQDPAMKRVYSRYISEMDDLTRTTYSREEGHFVDVDGKFGEGHFQRGFYSEISTAGTPVVMDSVLRSESLSAMVSTPLFCLLPG